MKFNDLDFVEILIFTSRGLIEIAVICFLGFLISKKNIPPSLQKSITQLNIILFTPCLILTLVSSNFVISDFRDIILTPFLFLLITLISYFYGTTLSFCFNLNKKESGFVKAVAVFGNSGSYPILLCMLLANDLKGIKWDKIPDDSTEKMEKRSLLYVLIFLQISQFLRWSWGYNVLLKKNDENSLDKSDSNNNKVDSVIQESNLSSLFKIKSSSNNNTLLFDEKSITYDEHSKFSAHEISDYSNTEDHLSHNSRFNKVDKSVSSEIVFVNKKKKILIFFTKPFKKIIYFLNPPLIALIFSMIISFFPKLQYQIFINDDSFIKKAFIKPLVHLGSISIPLIILNLGASLYPHKKTEFYSKNYKKILILSVISRMILPPITIFPLFYLIYKKTNFLNFNDPIFIITAFILTSAPPAIQLSQLTQINNVFEKEMTQILFWSYVFLAFPITVISTLLGILLLKL